MKTLLIAIAVTLSSCAIENPYITVLAKVDTVGATTTQDPNVLIVKTEKITPYIEPNIPVIINLISGK